MALRVYIYKNENEKIGVVDNYYVRADNLPPIGIDELAERPSSSTKSTRSNL